MGLLDDAIREHLDLKRRRGADSSEVERQEQEALGPPAHGEFASSTPAEEPVAPEPELAPAPEPKLPAEPELPPEPEPERPAAVAAGPDPAPHGDHDEDWFEDSEPSPPGAPTREFTPEEAPAEEVPAEPAGEDVLEETPDFLQETPEHERLWFEQKPPRDFDLDH